MKWIWLDMDGTFVDLYNVNGWLEYLIAHDTTPYDSAEPIYDMNELNNVLSELKNKGWNIGIISWCSKDNNIEFNKRTEIAKKKWLKKQYLDKVIDKIIVTPYGMNKADSCRPYGYGILADDEYQNRNSWDLGETIDANENLIDNLKRIA